MQNGDERGTVLRQPTTPSSSAGADTVVGMCGPVSRRDVLYLGAGLVALATIPGCSRPEGPPDERTELRILRPEDLLSLRIALRNLRIESDGRGPARLARIDAGREASVLVRFPGQHIVEQTLKSVSDGDGDPLTLPALSRIAQPTQLVFRLPSDVNSIDLTLAALLDWDILELQASGADGAAPADDRSRIEMPVGLALSPAPTARWVHARRPVAHNGRVELWHTRLVGQGMGTVPTVGIQAPGYTPMLDWDPALAEVDRGALVGRSAEARTLILSPMGGWLDVHGRWEAAADVTRWEQVATAGQDQRIVVERNEGFIYPFGHRATMLSVTERKVEEMPGPDGSGAMRVAVLRQRDFVVVKEPKVGYRHGEMALQTLTVQSMVTPALRMIDKTAPVFWIETAEAKPYPFRFLATDWADRELVVEAPAVFVRGDADIGLAMQVYGEDAYRTHRQTDLQGQPAAVARFEPTAADDAPSHRPRSVGDTTLHLLTLAFAGVPAGREDAERPFRCTTDGMLVRIPSLEPFLDEAENRGWFKPVDPDATDNRGEVFAEARASDPRRIPMYFDRQADRSGGIAAPSFDVDGLSRIHGPVGNAELVRSGEGAGGGGYFNTEHATFLGAFPLTGLLQTESGGRSPAIPRIDFIISRKQPKPRDDKDRPDSEEKEKENAEPAYWEVGLGLTWTVPLGPFGTDSLVAFAPALDDDGKSMSKLEIAVKSTRRLGGGSEEPAKEDADAAAPAEPARSPSGMSLTASGKVSNFALVLNISKTDSFSIGFEHISVKLGPPKPPQKAEAKDKSDEPADDPQEPGEEKKASAVSPEVEVRLSTIDATGGLNILKRVIEAAASLPRLPDLPGSEPPTAYPAKMPGAGSADINVSLGPFEAPKFKLMQFEVSNVSATLGIGLNFLPRPTGPSTPPSVPDNVFSIRVASAEKPLTLFAAPWGGIAHLGLNFTPRRLTGFQFSLGVLNRTEFDFGAGKAKCEGSLAAAFTYWLDDGDHYQLDLILRLGGQAKLWFLDIHLMLTAAGSWSDRVWSFYAELRVRVQVSFFAVEARFSFYHQIADKSGENDRTGAADDEVEDDFTEAEWIAHRSAFAEAA